MDRENAITADPTNEKMKAWVDKKENNNPPNPVAPCHGIIKHYLF